MTDPVCPRQILLADDDPDDRILIREAFAEATPAIALTTVDDGAALLRHLRSLLDAGAALPALLLVDLNMPRKGGREALIEIRADERLRHLPVVVLTTSRSPAEIIDCYRLGANSFITKPGSFQGLLEFARRLQGFWFEHCRLPRP